MVKLRSERLDKDPVPYLREEGDDEGQESTAREALGKQDPLEAEKVLDRARWDLLESLDIEASFDLSSLIIYSLELQILDRLAGLDPEKGKRKVESVSERRRELN